MKRIIVDYKKLTPEILNLLVAKYPDEYLDRDIVVFKNRSVTDFSDVCTVVKRGVHLRY